MADRGVPAAARSSAGCARSASTTSAAPCRRRPRCWRSWSKVRRRGRVGRAERNPCQTELRSSLNRTPNPRRLTMTNHVYKHIEITGSAKTGTDDAVRNALAKAHETIRNIQWFRVVETRGHVVDGKVAHWQVTINVGFTLD